MRAIERAAAAVRRGEVVAIPTDALYTLVADPLNLHAVGRVFAAKGRESVRSLPLLVSDIVMAEELASEVSARFYLLARKFWPGPLTIIAPASSRVPLKVTGNTGTAGVAAIAIESCQCAARAAGAAFDRDQRESFGTAHLHQWHQVFGVMDGSVDLVLDGGTIAGAGATTIDVTEPYWRVIREGAIAEKEIAEVLKGS